jgi:hypothetical protein
MSLSLALAGCAQGDFGRISPLMKHDNMHAWLAYDATQEPMSPLPLTADERLLRDLGYPLIVQPYQRDRIDAVVHEYGLTKPYARGTYDRTAYANHLMLTWRRSPESAYAQLIDDVRNDITRLPQFFGIAARVRDVDERRRRSMFYIASASEAERGHALQRMKENAAIVDWVRETLDQRALSYRFALERLVMAAPNKQAAEAERLINDLHARSAFYRRHLPPPYAREPSLARAG